MIGAAFLVAFQLQTAMPRPDVELSLREGLAYRVAGDNEHAVASFAHAYELQPGALTAGQLGLAEQAAGRWVDADRHVSEALAQRDDGWVVRHRAALDAAYAVIREHVGSLDIRGGVDGAEVRLDGATVATLPLHGPLRVRAGAYTLEVRAEGYYPVSRPLTVHADQVTLEPIELRSREPTEPTASPPPVIASPLVVVHPDATPRAQPIAPPRTALSPLVPAFAGGAALVFAGFGIGFLVDREVAAVAYDAPDGLDCPHAAMPSSACRDLLNRGAVDVPFAIGSFVLSAAAVSVTIWGLLHLAPDRPRYACAPRFDQPGGACFVRF